MQNKIQSDDQMIRFLLGEVSEEERAAIEERFLADGHYFEELLATEEYLIEAYINNELPDTRRDGVRKLLGSSKFQSQELELTKDLIANLKKFAPSSERLHSGPDTTPLKAEAKLSSRNVTSRLWLFRPPFFVRLATLVLIFSLVGLSIYLLSQKFRYQAEMDALKKKNEETLQQLLLESKRNEELSNTLKDEQSRRREGEELIARLQTPSADGTMRIALYPDDTSRGLGELKQVFLSRSTTKLQFRLRIEEHQEAARFVVTLRTFEKQTLWTETLDSNQMAQGQLNLTVSASRIPDGDYIIEVKPSGSDKSIDYAFRIKRK